MKKLWALLLVVAMLAAALPAALADSELEEYRITVLRETLTEGYSTDEFAIGQILYDKFKIAIDYVPYSGDWTQYCSLRLTGGDYPELMQLNDQQIAQAYIDAGALLSFDDYADLLPDFFARYPETCYESGRSFASDGKLYFFQSGSGSVGATSNTHLNWSVRSDLLEEQGWPFVFTASEWVEFFKTAKANHPTTDDGLELFVDIPFGEAWGFNTLFVPSIHYNADHIKNIDYETYQVSDSWTTVMMHEVMAFWNELWREDLLDPECFTDKSDQLTAKSNTTQCMASWYARWLFGGTNQAFIDAGTPQYQYVEMPFVVDSLKDDPYPQAKPGSASWTTGFGDMVVTKNCKYPERIMELINYLHSDEGVLLYGWGVEGEDYYVDPETGKRDATPELVEMAKNDPDAYRLRGFGCFINLSAAYEQGLNPKDMQPGNIRYSTAIQQVSYTDRQIEAVQKIAGAGLPWDIFSDGVLPRPYAEYEGKNVGSATDIPADEVDLIDMRDEIRDYTFSMIPKIIMAETPEDFEAMYQECVEGRRNYGIDTIIAWMQERADEAVAAFDAAAAE